MYVSVAYVYICHICAIYSAGMIEYTHTHRQIPMGHTHRHNYYVYIYIYLHTDTHTHLYFASVCKRYRHIYISTYLRTCVYYTSGFNHIYNPQVSGYHSPPRRCLPSWWAWDRDLVGLRWISKVGILLDFGWILVGFLLGFNEISWHLGTFSMGYHVCFFMVIRSTSSTSCQLIGSEGKISTRPWRC